MQIKKASVGRLARRLHLARSGAQPHKEEEGWPSNNLPKGSKAQPSGNVGHPAEGREHGLPADVMDKQWSSPLFARRPRSRHE